MIAQTRDAMDSRLRGNDAQESVVITMTKAKPEKKVLPKRFYAAVDVQQNNDGFCITLDGKLLRTQGRNMLQLANAEMAAALAAEWEAQAQHIDPDTMPLTRLANLAIDRAGHDREAWLEEIARYGETDLLCYRAPDVVLRQRQASTFDPILAWAAQQGVALNVTDGVMPITQPSESLTMLRNIFAHATDHELAALAMLTPLLGSALLTLALWKGKISVEAALVACRLDEDFQAEQWGEDAEAAASWANKRRDILAATFFLDKLTPKKP